MARRRKIESLGNLSQQIISRIDPQGKRYESRAIQVWAEVAGAEIAKHTKGFVLRAGEFVVFVDSPAWANELTLMAERLRESINSRIGKDLVRTIRFTVSKKVQEEQRLEAFCEEDEEYYRPDEVQPLALSAEELRQAQYMAEAVPDPELQEKALRVMIKDLERKKGARAPNESQASPGGSGDANSGS